MKAALVSQQTGFYSAPSLLTPPPTHSCLLERLADNYKHSLKQLSYQENWISTFNSKERVPLDQNPAQGKKIVFTL